MNNDDAGAAVHLVDDSQIPDPGSIGAGLALETLDVSASEGVLLKSSKATVESPDHIGWDAFVIALGPAGEADVIHRGA